MTMEEMIPLHTSLGKFIRKHFRLYDGNEALMKSCLSVLGNEIHHADDPSSVIVKHAWEKIKETHSLKVAK